MSYPPITEPHNFFLLGIDAAYLTFGDLLILKADRQIK